jgi:hypothetical protein
MGRHKIYKTQKDKYEAEKKWKREYYYRNKEKLNKQSMRYYREKHKAK